MNAKWHLHTATSYVGGPQVAGFEREFAYFLGVKRVVGVGSGTDALRMALLAIGVGPGDEVITSPMTFIATAAAIFQTGARPVFRGCRSRDRQHEHPRTAQLSRNRRDRAQSGPRASCRCICTVLPAPILELKEIADEFDLKMVEDACQAHGARISTANGWG